MFFDKIESVLFLERNRLTLFTNNNKLTLEIPKSVTSFLTILKPDQYEELLEDFFSNINLEKQKAVLVLAKDIVFEKIFNNEQDSKEVEQTYIQKVPLQKESLVKVRINYSDTISIFAANSELFIPIVDQAKKSGIEIISVVPIVIYQDESNDPEFNADTVELILTAKRFLDEANFLKSTNEMNENEKVDSAQEDDSNKKITHFEKYKRLLQVILIILLFLTAGGLFIFAITQKPEAKEVEEPIILSNEPLPTAEASASSQITYSARSELKIRILNGSGRNGIASQVKESLINEGFIADTIEIGNLESKGDVDTTIVIKERVSKEDNEKIATLLQQLFLNVVKAETIQETDNDIEITTGILK